MFRCSYKTVVSTPPRDINNSSRTFDVNSVIGMVHASAGWGGQPPPPRPNAGRGALRHCHGACVSRVESRTTTLPHVVLVHDHPSHTRTRPPSPYSYATTLVVLVHIPQDDERQKQWWTDSFCWPPLCLTNRALRPCLMHQPLARDPALLGHHRLRYRLLHLSRFRYQIF